jgi:hypothetical protein
MATPTRLKGNAGFYLTIKQGETTATPFSDDVRSFELSYKDKDDSDLTFTEAATGLGQFAELKLTALVSLDTASLWQFSFSNPGAEVSVVLAPFGNAVATTTQPHIAFDATMPGKPGISNEAILTAKAKGQTYDILLTGVTDPEQVTTA